MIIVGGGGIGKEALTIKMQKVRDIIKEKPELKDIYYDFVFDDDDTKKSEEPIQNDTKKYFSSRYDPNAEQWDFPYNKIN